MALSLIEYTGDGSARSFTFSFSYLAQSHVEVLVDGGLLPTTAYSFLAANLIELNTAPAVGAVIRVQRRTPYDQLLVDFSSGYILAADLNKANLQSLFVVQEVQEQGTPRAEEILAIITQLEADAAASADQALVSRQFAAQAGATAEVFAEDAEQAAIVAQAAAAASGDVVFFSNYATAEFSAASLDNGQVVEVFKDETRNGQRVRYFVFDGDLINPFVIGAASAVSYESGLSVEQYLPFDDLYSLLIDPAFRIDNLQVEVRSFHKDLDAGDRRLYWDADRPKADANGVNIFDPDALGTYDGTLDAVKLASLHAAQGTNTGSGCFVDVDFTQLTPAMSGADPTGTNDSAVALQRLADVSAALSIPIIETAGVYRIDSPVDFRRTELTLGTINATFDDQPAVILGGTSNSDNNRPQRLFRVASPTTTPVSPTIRVIGAKGQRITIDKTDHFNIYADSDIDADDSTAYSVFDIKRCRRISLSNNPAPVDAQLAQWINENVFNLMRCFEFVVEPGNYVHNNNRINGGTFEGSALIDIDIGRSFVFDDIRFEDYGPDATPEVRFGAETTGNIVRYNYYTSLPDAGFDLIEDLGTNNSVQPLHSTLLTYVPLVDVSGDTVDAAPTRGISGLSPDPGGTVSGSGFNFIYESKLLPATATLRASVLAIGSSGGGIRGGILAYDANLNEITSSGDDYVLFGTGPQSFGEDNSPAVANNRGLRMYLTPAGAAKAAYVRLKVRCGGSGLTCDRFSVGIEYDNAWGEREVAFGHVTPESTAIT